MRWLSFIGIFFASIAAAETGSVTGQVHVSGAIVYVGVTTASQLPTNAVVEFRDGELRPHVQVARCAATVALRNADATLHIVAADWLSGTNPPARVLTQAMPYTGFVKSLSFEGNRESALVKIAGQNGENSQVAYVALLPTALAAISDEQGRFEITGVPAGNYKLFVWHEALGTRTRDVRVLPGRATNADVEFTSAVPPRSD